VAGKGGRRRGQGPAARGNIHRQGGRRNPLPGRRRGRGDPGEGGGDGSDPGRDRPDRDGEGCGQACRCPSEGSVGRGDRGIPRSDGAPHGTAAAVFSPGRTIQGASIAASRRRAQGTDFAGGRRNGRGARARPVEDPRDRDRWPGDEEGRGGLPRKAWDRRPSRAGGRKAPSGAPGGSRAPLRSGPAERKGTR
jgi:hypothetical protein